jgi:hypothetical protein
VPEPEVEGTLEIASWTFEPGEAEVVAWRLRHSLAG